MKNWLLLFCLMFARTVCGQQTAAGGADAATLAKAKLQVMSPQTADMVRYDNTEIAETSGRLDLSVPLIEFQDPDFELPISVSYNSAGFKPADPDNYVGRNWSLNCGGMIYREIKGIPDELKSSVADGANGTRGFLFTTREGYYSNTIAETILNGDPATILMTPLQGTAPVFRNNTKLEFSSDIYHFRFGRHSGKFMINFDGTVHVMSDSGGDYKVDLSRFSTDGSVYSAQICITTDDGYTYYFGGDYSTVEYTAFSWTDNPKVPIDYRSTNHVTSFYLSKVEAPNGRRMNIRYKNNIDPRYHTFPYELTYDMNYDALIRNNSQLLYTLIAKPYDYESLDNVVGIYSPPLQISINQDVPNHHFGNSYSLNKIALVSEIYTDDKTVQFYYSPRKFALFSKVAECSKFGQACGAQLDSVVLYDGSNRKIESSALTYSYKGGQWPRMFLNRIANTKSGVYSFEYYGSAGLPEPCTTNVDHWGYWRGDYENTRLLPSIKYSSTLSLDYQITSDTRESYGSRCNETLLKSIRYPTGGFAQFEYEPHSYSVCVDADARSSWVRDIKTLTSFPAIAGGARVKTITYHNSGETIGYAPVKQTVYKYTPNLKSDQSSGILMYKPRYAHFVRTRPPGVVSGYQFFALRNDSGFDTKEYATDHVLYSTVIKYQVDNYVSRPDSILRFVHTPAYADKDVQIHDVAVGYLGDAVENGEWLERKYATWTFRGYGKNGGEATIYIINPDTGGKVFEHTFSQSKMDSVSFNPLDKFSKGHYQLVLKKRGEGFVECKMSYPHTAYDRISGPVVITKYTDYKTNPDAFPDKHSVWNNLLARNSFLPCPSVDEQFMKRFFLEPEDHSNERGKLLSRTMLAANLDTVRHESYVYEAVGDRTYNVYAVTPRAISNAPLYLFTQVNKVLFHTYKPRTITTTEYFGADRLTVTEDMKYYPNGYLGGKQITTPTQIKLTSYEYAAYEEDMNPYFKSSNMLSLITGVREDYMNSPLPESKGQLLYYDVTGAPEHPVVVLKSVCNLTGEEITDKTDYTRFDQYGNAMETVQNDAVRTVYLWGYMGKYVIGKVENATYEEVAAALGKDPAIISDSMVPDMDAVNSLRALLPEAHVTTYSYIPLVGISSATDPAGNTTYYKYDKSGRLAETYILGEDGEKQLLQFNEYNFVNK